MPESRDSQVYHQQHPIVQEMPSFCSGINQDAKLCNIAHNSGDASTQEQSECEVAAVTAGAFAPK